MPTTHGSFDEQAKDNKDSWICMDDFAMASSEDALLEYADSRRASVEGRRNGCR
jgi:hypothetical protein